MPGAGYSGTPLPRKLGIKPGHRVLVVGAPVGFELGELPDGAVVSSRAGRGAYDVVLAFCPDRAAFARRYPSATRRIPPTGAVWVAWPKKSSGAATDLDEAFVRSEGLASGLVDNKVCAVDDTWSGLRFVVRLADR